MGPDIALIGAARSGTSFLAAHIGHHPAVDGGAVKEPDFFSKHLDKGTAWYEALYQPRSEGLLRLDASTSYTVPAYPNALRDLARAAPNACVVYAVRDPLERAVSHYHYLKSYQAWETATTFGDAIRGNGVYLGASDYRLWLSRILDAFPGEQVLVAPFPLVTGGEAVTTQLWHHLGLAPPESPPDQAALHRNEVATFRSDTVRTARRLLKRYGAYPWLRRRVGADRMRRLRSVLTQPPEQLGVAAALASCDARQQQEIRELAESGHTAVAEILSKQDARLGLDWTNAWPPPPWLQVDARYGDAGY